MIAFVSLFSFAAMASGVSAESAGFLSALVSDGKVSFDRDGSNYFAADMTTDSAFLSTDPGLNEVKSYRMEFIEGHEEELHQRRLQTEFTQACSNPSAMYEGTGKTVDCFCDQELETIDRVVCEVAGIDCSAGTCTQEFDIWFFDKQTLHMNRRSTCLICVDSDGCSQWDDVCFTAYFDDNDDVSSCEIVYQDLGTICSNCQPCVAEGQWGMNFECLGGQQSWSTQDACLTGSRVGLHPFDNGNTPTGSGNVSPTVSPPTGSPPTGSPPTGDEGDDSSSNTGVIVGVVVFVLVLVGVVGGVVACMMRKKGGDSNEKAQEQQTAYPVYPDPSDTAQPAEPSSGDGEPETYAVDL